MLFNSYGFAVFLPIVFLLYWFIAKKSIVKQNFLLIIASYFFYACWDYRFLFLLIFSTILDYFTAIKMSQSSSKVNKKLWFWISIIINLGFLGVFKYYNFFAESFINFISFFGFEASYFTLNIILPVGISFYTFHGLSYVIDIYYNRIKPERNFVDYSLFVCYFPLLVAGPIERATHLLPQIKRKRNFDYYKAVDGLKQILWGLFKKMVIADNCAEFANLYFNNYNDYSGSSLILGAIFFTFQIYCDFSGYSDIALGTSRLFGIELLRNFSFPYFSRDIAEFWRRWHISLSSWFRDYLYIPLGGSKGGMWMKVRNTFIIFIVSGFWHGANWTFIVWGFLNALYFMPLLLTNNNRNNFEIVAKGRFFPSFRDALNMFLTFTLTVFAWIFFRADNLEHAFSYIKKIFESPFLNLSDIPILSYVVIVLIIFFILIEWIGRTGEYALQNLKYNNYRFLEWCFYFIIIISIFLFAGKEQDFIYFQF
ncbi:MAG: MBOAT family O-acyltransferase [Flavobacterium sp.]|jgi:alginate O-acetyltransferase complex protein AlgI|uniref:MBOAT family O-acyltransferase n=1 Tax=Flavobacterium sp. TaxID=239 RepID=UPI002607D2F5|nr:MBOAT family O-acyltransferase [Flavobacterium sp.]TAF09693.1 MAG: MBOAT family protein [Flavobacteriia bacterium]WRH72875.1 MAG: MBOAT family O-acyltransferase [Flavobacterium sp.]